MSYLDQFLKETSSSQQQQQQQTQSHSAKQYDVSSVHGLLHQGGSIESEEGDIEDNRASISSSRSNLSELSLVSCVLLPTIFYILGSS